MQLKIVKLNSSQLLADLKVPIEISAFEVFSGGKFFKATKQYENK